MSVYTCKHFLLICVYINNKYIDVTRSDIDLVEYPHFINTCYSCVFPVLIRVSAITLPLEISTTTIVNHAI